MPQEPQDQASGQDRDVNIFLVQAVEIKSPFDVDKLADRFRLRNTGWTITEAILGILLQAAMADGNFDAEEVATIQAIARRSRALNTLSPGDLAAINNTVNARLSDRNALRDACQTLPSDMCLPIFAHCVDVVLSDGQLVKPEVDFLTELCKLMNIERDDARRVMEVLLLKAQY